MRDWPSELKFRNEFIANDVDLETFPFPKVTVHTYSNVFGSDGSVVAQGVWGTHRIDLAQMSYTDSSEVDGFRHHLQDMADYFNDGDLKAQWLDLFQKAAQFEAAYRIKQVEGFDEMVKAKETAIARLDMVERLIEDERAKEDH